MKVETSNENKVLFPESGITKGQVIDYYRRHADLLIRHAGGRSLSFRRCPDGIAGRQCFFQKDAPDHFPDWIETAKVATKSRTIEQVIIQREEDLVYLANQGCIEFHAPLATVEHPHQPDKLIVDLDPPEDVGFDLVRDAAREVRDHLQGLGLQPFLMTTGSKGLHIVVPLQPDLDFDQVRQWAREQASALATRNPDWMTTEIRKARRGGRLFLDVGRNAYGQTGIAPYSLRTIEGAPVACPLDWSELSRVGDAQRYHLGNLHRRLARREDPWKDFGRSPCRLG